MIRTIPLLIADAWEDGPRPLLGGEATAAGATVVQTAFRAHREFEVGGVVVGDVPSYRAHQMPYGGTKESGVGREGVRSTMVDLTYERVMVLTGLDL